MILHTVIFTWKEGVTQQQVTAFQTELDRLPHLVGTIRSLQHGSDLALRGGMGDHYTLVATFDDAEGWRDYQAHPAHKAFVENFVVPMQKARLATQIAI